MVKHLEVIMESIGKLGITSYGIGLIIGKEMGSYKVLFQDRVEVLKDLLVGPEVYFVASRDTLMFKRGTKLYLRKTFDNTFLSIRLGNKKGSDWFSQGYYDIYCQEQKINLMRFIDTSKGFIEVQEKVKKPEKTLEEPLNPQSDLIKYMMLKSEYLGDRYLYNSDMLRIKMWKYDRSLEILRHIVMSEENYLTTDGCPFCIFYEGKCSNCTYKDLHTICGSLDSDFQWCKRNSSWSVIKEMKIAIDAFKETITKKYGW